MLSDRAINEMICSTSPTSGQSTLTKNWQLVKTATHSEKQPVRSPNIPLALDILAVRERPISF